MKQKVTTTGPDGMPCVIEVDVTEASNSERTQKSWNGATNDSALTAAVASMATAMACLVEPADAAALNEAAAKLMKGASDGNA